MEGVSPIQCPPKAAPRPIATLRHHTSALTTVGFMQGNQFLLSGDCDGVVALWQLLRRRVLAEWRPHLGSAVLKAQQFGNACDMPPKILTQGRDGLVQIWDTSRLNFTPRRASATSTTQEGTNFMATIGINTGSYSFCKCATLRWSKHTSISKVSDQSKGNADFEVVERNCIDDGVRDQLSQLLPDPILLQSPPEEFAPRNDTHFFQEEKSSYENIFAGSNGPMHADQWVATPSPEAQTIQLWDVRGKRLALSLRPSSEEETFQSQGHGIPKTGMLMCLALVDPSYEPPIQGKNPLIVAGYESGHICIFDLVAGKMRCMTKVHDEPILSLDVDRHASQIVTGAAETTIGVTSLSTVRAEEEESSRSTGISIASSPYQIANNSKSSGGNLASSLQAASMTVPNDLRNGDIGGSSVDGDHHKKTQIDSFKYSLRKNDFINIEKAGIESITLRGDHGHNYGLSTPPGQKPHGGIFACAGWDHRVRIFEWMAPQRPLALLKQHTSGVCSVAWSDDGTFLASAAKDGNISLWSIFPALSKGSARVYA